MSRTARAWMAALGAALAVTGCAGPLEPLSVGHKELQANVVIGAAETPSEPIAQVPPTALSPQPPTRIPLIPAIFSPDSPTDREVDAPARPAPSAPPPACPDADPLAPVALEATNRIIAPPAPGTYRYRNTGSFEKGGADASKGTYEVETERTVQNVRRVNPDLFLFDVAATLDETVTTTTYELQRTNADNDGSLRIGRVVTAVPDGRVDTFTPQPPVTLLEFPVEPGKTTGTRVSTDASSQTTLTYEATVGQKKRVDACGVPLDAHTVNFRGTFTRIGTAALTETVTVEAEYAIATQFGGLSIADTVTVDGTEDGNPVRRSNSAVINSVPRLPTEPAQ